MRLGSDFIVDFIPILSQKYFIMARKPRIEYPGALFHIITRGNNGEDIFHDDEDRGNYLKRLGLWDLKSKPWPKNEQLGSDFIVDPALDGSPQDFPCRAYLFPLSPVD